MVTRRMLAGLLSAAAASACATGAGPTVSVGGGWFAPAVAGDVGLSSTATTDVDVIDLGSDLDLGDRDSVPYVRGGLDVGPLDLALSAFQTSTSGSGTATADFGAIAAGSNVASELDLALFHGSLTVDLVDMEWLELGVGLAAEYIDLELDVREEAFGLRENVQITQPIPLLAARVVVRPPWIPADLSLDVGALQGRYGDIEGTMLDIEALLHVEIAGPVSLFGGYRYVHLELNGAVDHQDIDGDLTLSGFLAGISVRF